MDNVLLGLIRGLGCLFFAIKKTEGDYSFMSLFV